MLLAQTRPFDPARNEISAGGIVTIKGLEVIFENIITIALGFGGIALFIMLLQGGFSLLQASGEPQKAEAAKKTITFAIGGLVAMVLAFLVLQLIKGFTGVDLTKFKVVQ